MKAETPSLLADVGWPMACPDGPGRNLLGTLGSSRDASSPSCTVPQAAEPGRQAHCPGYDRPSERSCQMAVFSDATYAGRRAGLALSWQSTKAYFPNMSRWTKSLRKK